VLEGRGKTSERHFRFGPQCCIITNFPTLYDVDSLADNHLETGCSLGCFWNCHLRAIYLLMYGYFYLARSANLPTGLYILPSVISSFFKSTKYISASTGPIFTIVLPYERYVREFSRSRPHFQIHQGTFFSLMSVCFSGSLLSASIHCIQNCIHCNISIAQKINFD